MNRYVGILVKCKPKSSALVTALAFFALLAGVVKPPTAHGQLSEDVLKKLKHGTVHLRVKLANGSTSEGSGWFLERGLIITNAHVLNMHGGDKRFPTKIDVTIDGGETTSQTISAKFQGGYYDADLMLLKVDGNPDELPEPLTLNPEATLNETQEVYALGFPLGKSLGNAITVSKTSISSLRKDNGKLKEIQLNGGIHPGNSGGPIVNERGEVIGVAVGGVQGTAINFAIPADSVSQLVNGTVIGLKVEQSYLDGTQIRIPVKVVIVDPLERISGIRLQYWTKPKIDNKPQSASFTKPSSEEGDGPVNVATVPISRKGLSAVEVVVPPLPDEESTYWFRAVIKDGQGRAYWSAPSGNLRPVPLDRREVTLKYKGGPGKGKPIQISNDASFKVKVGPRTETMSMSVRVEAIPQWLPADADGDSRGIYRYGSVSVGMKQNGQPVNAKERWGPVNQNFLKTTAEVVVSREGAVVSAQPILTAVDPRFRADIVGISDIILQSMELLSISLPEHSLKHGDRIRQQKMFLVGLPSFYFPTVTDVKYQYLGVRKKHKEETAYFSVAGELRPRRGDDVRLSGRMNGTLEVSLETGEVIYGNCISNLEIDTSGAGGVRLIGTLATNVKETDSRPRVTLKPNEIEVKSQVVPDGHVFNKGQIVFAYSAGDSAWLQAEVLRVNDDGKLAVHFIGWSDAWDTMAAKDQIRLPKE